MPRQIHQDVIDQIIYALRDDRTTLLQCCTVSHLFLIPSCKQLFFDLNIPFLPSAGLNKLIHVLSVHPGHLSYIRILGVFGLAIQTLEESSFVRWIEDLADRRLLGVLYTEET